MPSQRSRISGSIVDFGGYPRQKDWAPQLHILPSKEAGAVEGFLSSVVVPVPLTAEMTFDFYAIASEDIRPPTPVTFRLRWLDAAGNFIQEDFWRDVWLPAGDWSMGTLLAQKGVGHNQVIWQAEEPAEAATPLGALWVNTETGTVLREDRVSIKWEYVTNIRGRKGAKGDQGAPGLPGTNGVPTDAAVAALVGNGSSAASAAWDARYIRLAPAPTGGDDTSMLQALVDEVVSNGGGEIVLQPGIYKVACIETDPSPIQPILRGAGRDATIIESDGTDFAVRFVGVSGSTAAVYSPGAISDLTVRSATGTGGGVELVATIGVRLERVTFEALDVGLRFHNRDAGTWTEFNVAIDCWWKWTVRTALEYKRTNGDASFHGCGVGGTSSIIEQPTAATGPSVLIGNGCLPYNAPLDVGFFVRSPTQALIHNAATTRTPVFVGTVRVECFAGAAGAGVLASMAGANTVALAGRIVSLNNAATNGFTWGAVTLVSSQYGGRIQPQVFAESSGFQLMSATAAGVVSVAVTFPTGRFTQAPHVTASVITGTPQNHIASVGAVTKDGFTLYLYSSAATADRKVQWHAVQMAAGSVSG